MLDTIVCPYIIAGQRRELKMKFTPTQWKVLVAAYMTGDATNANIANYSAKTRTISRLKAMGFLHFNREDKWHMQLTPAGEEAYWSQAR